MPVLWSALPGTVLRSSWLVPPLPYCAPLRAGTLAWQVYPPHSLGARCKFFVNTPAPVCCSLRHTQSVRPETPATVRPSRILPECALAQNSFGRQLSIRCASLCDMLRSLETIPPQYHLFVQNKHFQEIRFDTAAVLSPPPRLPKGCVFAAHLYVYMLCSPPHDSARHQSNDHKNIYDSIEGIPAPVPSGKFASHRMP